MENLPVLKLYDIAKIIRDDHRKNGKAVYFGAVPYLEAMACLSDVKENYGADTGRSVVCYLLANLQSWRGETARNVKKELNRRIK